MRRGHEGVGRLAPLKMHLGKVSTSPQGRVTRSQSVCTDDSLPFMLEAAYALCLRVDDSFHKNTVITLLVCLTVTKR